MKFNNVFQGSVKNYVVGVLLNRPQELYIVYKVALSVAAARLTVYVHIRLIHVAPSVVAVRLSNSVYVRLPTTYV
jgi:hypothetical protein